MNIEEQKQKSKKNNLLDKYKEKVIKKQEKEINEYKNASGSWILMNRIGGIILDLLGWLILLITLYIGWKSGRWEDITCNRISPDFCNSCFIYGKQLLSNVTNNINGINFGIEQLNNISMGV